MVLVPFCRYSNLKFQFRDKIVALICIAWINYLILRLNLDKGGE